MAPHTPTPWRLDPLVATHILGANGRPVATTGGFSSNTEPDNGRAENEGNATLIIRAGNSHEALLAACKALARYGHALMCPGERPETCPGCAGDAAVKLAEKA